MVITSSYIPFSYIGIKMIIKKVKQGYSIHLENNFPTEKELKKINSLDNNDYFICNSRGYKRLLVRSYGRDILPCVMECPINQYFRT